MAVVPINESVVIPDESVSAVVALLEEVLASARKGEISGVVMAWRAPNGSFFSGYTSTIPRLQCIGLAAALMHDLNHATGEV